MYRGGVSTLWNVPRPLRGEKQYRKPTAGIAEFDLILQIKSTLLDGIQCDMLLRTSNKPKRTCENTKRCQTDPNSFTSHVVKLLSYVSGTKLIEETQ